MELARNAIVDTDFSSIDFSSIDMLDIEIVETSELSGLPETGASCCGAAVGYHIASCSSCCVVPD